MLACDSDYFNDTMLNTSAFKYRETTGAFVELFTYNIPNLSNDV